MDHKETATSILRLVGGAQNIISAAHCATRLRLVLKDQNLADKAGLEALDAVKGTFLAGGQFQIVIGQGVVNRVYEQLVEQGGIKAVSTAEVKNDAAANQNILQRIARTLSNVFVPIIPVIVACGLLMGTLGTMRTMQWLSGDSALFQLLDMFSNTAFVFLPILIAFSAAREFRTNAFVAAALGGILIHPALQNAWTVGGGVQGYWDLFGFQIAKLGYQGTVLPILIAVWAMAHIERLVRKIVPDVLDIILTPFLTLLISGIVALTVIGPAGRLLGDGISMGLQGVYSHAGFLAGAVFGGGYSAIVITGVHHSFHAIEAGLLSNPAIGVNFLLPIWAMANVAQGGAAFAVFFRTKDVKTRQVALPAAISCLLGITEAAMFGVNLRFVRPFIAAAVGGAIAGSYVVFMNVGMTAVGVTGIPGIAIVKSSSIGNYIVGMLIAFAVAFIGTWFFGLSKTSVSDQAQVKPAPAC